MAQNNAPSFAGYGANQPGNPPSTEHGVGVGIKPEALDEKNLSGILGSVDLGLPELSGPLSPKSFAQLNGSAMPPSSLGCQPGQGSDILGTVEFDLPELSGPQPLSPNSLAQLMGSAMPASSLGYQPGQGQGLWGLKGYRHEFLNNFGLEMPEDQSLVHRGLLAAMSWNPPTADAWADAMLYLEGFRIDDARYEGIYGLAFHEVLDYTGRVDYDILDLLNKRADMANTKAGVPAHLERLRNLFCRMIKMKLKDQSYTRETDDGQSVLYETFWVDCLSYEKALEDDDWEYDEWDANGEGVDVGDDEQEGQEADDSRFSDESYVEVDVD